MKISMFEGTFSRQHERFVSMFVIKFIADSSGSFSGKFILLLSLGLDDLYFFE